MKTTILMKTALLLSLPLMSASMSALAEWKEENVSGLQTILYSPKNVSPGDQLALIVNLHGCAQKADDLKKDGNWETSADEYKMIVALPRVPNGGVYSGCWDYYGSDHTVTNRHNKAIIDMVKTLLSRKDLNIDPGQVYISGLSSGGGESMILGCLAPDLFAGMGLNAGPSTGTTANEIGRPKTAFDKMLATCKNLAGTKTDFLKTQLTSIIYGNNDFIVSPVHDTNNAQIMSAIYGADIKSTFDTKKLEGTSTDGTGTLLSDQKGPRISLIMNTNLGHNWPAGQGGNAGNFISKKSINYPAYLTKFFFQNNRRSSSVKMPELLVSSIESQNNQFTLSGALHIPAKKVKRLEIVVSEKATGAEVDKIVAVIDGLGAFKVNSRPLKEGEYLFTLKMTKRSGLSSSFKRIGWMGEVAGEMTPQLFNVHFESIGDCLELKGQAVTNGGDKLSGVHILLDNLEIGQAIVEATSMWTFKSCGLKSSQHELGVYVKNESDLKSTVQSFTFVSELFAATSSLQAHMESARLKWATFGDWYLKYGNKTFTLYQWPDLEWREEKPID